jgi:hypothetical protein
MPPHPSTCAPVMVAYLSIYANGWHPTYVPTCNGRSWASVPTIDGYLSCHPSNARLTATLPSTFGRPPFNVYLSFYPSMVTLQRSPFDDPLPVILLSFPSGSGLPLPPCPSYDRQAVPRRCPCWQALSWLCGEFGRCVYVCSLP